jgi:nucleoside-triphosphatase THEP1
VTVQPEDVEPESARAKSTPAHWAADPNFTQPERVPWSELWPDFLKEWGGKPWNQREHLEIVGPSGSGKTYLMETILQGRYREQKTGAIMVCTKQDDEVFRDMGWPMASTVGEIRDTNVIFWPRTGRKGLARKDFYNQHITALLDNLWQPGADTIVAFDEVGYIESLSAEVRALVQMYWREARSVHIQLVAMKQRPQGALRDMHSETYWTAAFAPNDRSDLERFSELFGHRRDWMPVFDSLDSERHEFIIRHAKSKEAYISWVDEQLSPQKIQRKGLHSLVSR